MLVLAKLSMVPSSLRIIAVVAKTRRLSVEIINAQSHRPCYAGWYVLLQEASESIAPQEIVVMHVSVVLCTEKNKVERWLSSLQSDSCSAAYGGGYALNRWWCRIRYFPYVRHSTLAVADCVVLATPTVREEIVFNTLWMSTFRK
jgi:hypothetical protein